MAKKKHKTKAEKEFLSAIQGLGCIICEREAEIHHLSNGAMGMKSPHFVAIPLCFFHHRGAEKFGDCIHNGNKTFEKKHGTEKELLEKTIKKLGY